MKRCGTVRRSVDRSRISTEEKGGKENARRLPPCYRFERRGGRDASHRSASDPGCEETCPIHRRGTMVPPQSNSSACNGRSLLSFPFLSLRSVLSPGSPRVPKGTPRRTPFPFRRSVLIRKQRNRRTLGSTRLTERDGSGKGKGNEKEDPFGLGPIPSWLRIVVEGTKVERSLARERLWLRARLRKERDRARNERNPTRSRRRVLLLRSRGGPRNASRIERDVFPLSRS